MDNASLSPGSAYGQLIPFAFPGIPNVGCAFSTSLAGTLSLVTDPGSAGQAIVNRRRILARLGLERWSEVKQVHGKDMIVDPAATPLDTQPEREADGSCTREAGLALVIKTADCQPILLADMRGKAVAALHVGWRGNVLNFPGTGLKRFCAAYGLEPAEVMAVRGPSLGPEAAEFVNFADEWPAEFKPWFNEQRKTMDLWQLTRQQLCDAGMRPEHIFSLDLCTRSLPGLFFSYRQGHAGRQGSFIWLRGE